MLLRYKHRLAFDPCHVSNYWKVFLFKYHLLLQRYLKLTDKDDEFTYPIMTDALNLMKKTNDDINSHITDDISTNRLLSKKSISQLKEMYGQILKEVRLGLCCFILTFWWLKSLVFVEQGDLYMMETKKIHSVILFENILVIKEPSPVSTVFHSIAVWTIFEVSFALQLKLLIDVFLFVEWIFGIFAEIFWSWFIAKIFHRHRL